MALREFRDDRGQSWQVCNVQPSYVERRTGAERRRTPRPGTVDRRVRRQHRMTVAPRFRAGWLIFESRTERRRLGPIPAGWEQCGDEELCAMLRDAETLRSLG